MLKKRRCLHCNRLFQPTNYQQKYCTHADCRRAKYEAYLKYQRKYHKKKKAKKKVENKKIIRPCLSSQRGLRRSPQCTGEAYPNHLICKACHQYNLDGAGRTDGDYLFCDAVEEVG